MTYGKKRKEVLDRIRDKEPPFDLITSRSKLPPPPSEILKALLDVCRDYGRIKGFGYSRLGETRQRRWAALYYLSVFPFVCWGLRPNEAVVLRRRDFVFNPVQQIDIDLPPYVWIYRGDTESGEPKAHSQRALPMPSRSIPIFKECFDIVKLREADYIMTSPMEEYPRTISQIEKRWKSIAKAASIKRPDLKINPKYIYPYIARNFLSTKLTDILRDGGIMAGEIDGHADQGFGFERTQGKMARKHYVRHSLEQQRDALDKALEGILPATYTPMFTLLTVPE